MRFIASDNKIYYGDAAQAGTPTTARVITGDIFGTHALGETKEVKRLLCPIDPARIRTVRGIGLNYRKHAKETNLPIPKYPILFHKPSTSITGPHDPIYIPKLIQSRNTSDYECELVIVMGTRCKDVTEAEAVGCILGYSVGNDVSQREWQMELGGTQWSFSKGFDASAPLGPQIVSPSILHDASGLRIKTTIAGETLQDSSTSDLIFSVPQIVAFLSQGTTLMPGDVIYTGTPEGVGLGRTPKRFLKDGEVVEVELEGVGKCSNQVIWEKSTGIVRANL